MRLNCYVNTFIAVGSNLGDSLQLIDSAYSRIHKLPLTSLHKTSKIIRTKPIGPVAQNDFYNSVAQVHTQLSPHELLTHLQKIEIELGRTRTIRWGPRTMDLDILYFGDACISDNRLQVPHPEISNRPFLLASLEELGVVVHKLLT